MFVKVVQPYDEGASSQILYEVEEVRFGTVVTHLPINKRDFSQEIGAGFKLLHSNGLTSEPDGQDDVGDWWMYRYAVWHDVHNDNIVVVTSGDIYILSNSGRTIERVAR